MKKIKTFLFFLKLIWNANRLYLIYITILSLLNWSNTIVSVLFTERLLTYLEEGSFISSVISVATMLTIFFTTSIIQNWISSKQTVSQKDVQTKMRAILGNHYVSLPYYITSQHGNQEVYEMAVKCVNNAYAEIFVSNVLRIIFNIGTIISLMYILRVFSSWIFLLFAIVFAVDIIVYLRQANLLYANYIDETPIERGLYYSRGRLMRIEYAKEIRLYGLKNFISKKTEDSILAFYKQSEKTRKLELRKLLWTYLAEAVQFIGIYMLAIFEYYKNHSMTIGEFSLILTSSTSFSHSIRAIAADGVSIYKNLKYIEMLKKFLELIPTNSRAVNINSSERHHFCFENVSFKYDDAEKDALYDINVDFFSDDKISVVGESGAGKTTFILLLLGFLKPTKGRILVDGRDIREISRNDYIGIFSPVFQDYKIYSTSIIENITLSLDYNEKHFLQTIKKVKLNINEFPQCEKTIIGNIYDPKGIELSGGQAQKVALARALYKQSAMFILDEPTAALDPRAECDLYLNFNNIAGKRGCIFISHRLASCKLCEKIFVFDKGNLAEIGSHSTLMMSKGIYHSMFTAQAEKFFNNSEGV